MREINFFQQLKLAKKSTHHKWLLTALIPSVLAAVVLLAFFAVRMSALRVEADTKSKRDYLNSEEVIKARALYEEKKAKLDLINKYNASLDSINGALNSIDMINTPLLDKLEAALPKDTVFKSLAISNGSLKITGECTSRITAAELLHNLGSVDALENVKISSITKSSAGNTQTFNLEAGLKGGNKK